MFIENIFEVTRHLFHQAIDRSSNQSLLMILWSFIALVLSCSYSGKVLSLIITSELKNINNIDELVHSNLDIFTNNNSWIYWHLNGNRIFNQPLGKDISKIHNRIRFLPINEKELKV